MRRLLPLVLVCAAIAPARADGFYVTEGLGGTRVKDELSAYMTSAMRIRLSAGLRHGPWALEAFLAGAINTSTGYQGDPYASPPRSPEPGAYPPDRPDGYRGPTNLTTWGLDLKYLQPVAPHVDVYLRGSMSAGVADGALDGWSGRGLGLGAGVQLKGKVRALGFLWWPLFFTHLGPKVTAALWLDSGYEFYRLHGDRSVAIDAQLSHLTCGFAVGSDF